MAARPESGGLSVRYVVLRDGREIPVEIAERGGGYRVTVDGVPYDVDSASILPGLYSLLIGGESFEVTVFSPEPDRYRVHLYDGMRAVELVSPIGLVLKAQAGRGGGAGLTVKAPMPGRVVKLLVAQGDRVVEGQGVVVVEAMKMRNELRAPADGVVKEIRAAEGDSVESGAILAVLGEESAEF